MRNIPIFFLTMLVFAASAAHAEEPAYYRSTMPDGSIVFGDKPAPGAKTTKKILLPPPEQNRSMPMSSGSAPSSSEGEVAPPSVNDAIAAADDAVLQAQQKLEAANAALTAAQEPQPGERTGTAGGFSRLNDTYFSRIKRFEDAVAAAQKELDDAVAQRNALRP
jgi:hypothetical protein